MPQPGTAEPITDVDTDEIRRLEQQHRANELRLAIATQESQLSMVADISSLADLPQHLPQHHPGLYMPMVSGRALAGQLPQASSPAMEALYNPEDYINPWDTFRDNYGYQANSATFTTRSDRENGRNWPYWVSEAELAAIRGVSRVLCTYNPTAIGIMEALENHVVGKGFNVKALGKHASTEVLDVANRIFGEVDEENRIRGDLDQEIFRRRVRDGEAPLGLWHVGGGHVCLRTVEPDQISEPTGNKGDIERWLTYPNAAGEDRADSELGLPFDSNWSFGVHTTAGDSQAIHGHYVQWSYDTSDWDYMPGGNDPCYPPSDAGQDTWMEIFQAGSTDRSIKRGVSDFWPVAPSIELSRKLMRNLTHGGALQAAIAWVEEYAPGVTQGQATSATMNQANWQGNRQGYSGSGNEGTYARKMDGGTILRVSSGKVFKPGPMLQSAAGQALISIFEAQLRSIGVRWALPEHVITGSAANNNLASIQEAGTPFAMAVSKRQAWLEAFWLAIYWKCLWFAWRGGRFPQSADWPTIRKSVEIKITPPYTEGQKRKENVDADQVLVTAGAMAVEEMASRAGLDYQQQKDMGAKPQATDAGGAVAAANVKPQVGAEGSAEGAATKDVKADAAAAAGMTRASGEEESVCESNRQYPQSSPVKPPWWAGYKPKPGKMKSAKPNTTEAAAHA